MQLFPRIAVQACVATLLAGFLFPSAALAGNGKSPSSAADQYVEMIPNGAGNTPTSARPSALSAVVRGPQRGATAFRVPSSGGSNVIGALLDARRGFVAMIFALLAVAVASPLLRLRRRKA